MDIKELIKIENEIIEESISESEELITNSYNLVKLLSKIANVKNTDASAFFFLHRQVQNGLFQSLLSILRRHEIQAQIMLRHSIETACLSVYSLENTNTNDYIVLDDIAAKPVKGVERKAYNYLDKEFHEESKKLKAIKDNINQYFAHGNMFSSFKTFSKELQKIDYFDKKDSLLERTFIWQIGYVASIVFIMIYKASKKSSAVMVRKEAFDEFKMLLSVNQEFREEFLKEERLRRHSNII